MITDIQRGAIIGTAQSLMLVHISMTEQQRVNATEEFMLGMDAAYEVLADELKRLVGNATAHALTNAPSNASLLAATILIVTGQDIDTTLL